MGEDRKNDMPADVSTRPPSDLHEAYDGTYDGDLRLTEFAERRLDEAERLLEDTDVHGFTDVDDLLRHLGLV